MTKRRSFFYMGLCVALASSVTPSQAQPSTFLRQSGTWVLGVVLLLHCTGLQATPTGALEDALAPPQTPERPASRLLFMEDAYDYYDGAEVYDIENLDDPEVWEETLLWEASDVALPRKGAGLRAGQTSSLPRLVSPSLPTPSIEPTFRPLPSVTQAPSRELSTLRLLDDAGPVWMEGRDLYEDNGFFIGKNLTEDIIIVISFTVLGAGFAMCVAYNIRHHCGWGLYLPDPVGDNDGGDATERSNVEKCGLCCATCCYWLCECMLCQCFCYRPAEPDPIMQMVTIE